MSEALDVQDAGELIAARLAERDQPEPESELSEEPEAEEIEAEVEDGEEPEVEAEEEPEEAEIETLAQLAETLGVDVEALMGIRHQFKANGEEVEATLADLVAGNQKDADYRRKTQELAEQRKQFEQVMSEERQLYQQNALQLGHYLNSVEQMLTGAINSQEMEQLKAQDQTQWMIRRQEFQDRLDQVRQFRQAAANDWEQHQTMQQQQMQAQFQEFAQREQEALLSAVPDWNEDLRQGVNGFVAKQYGYTEEELNQVFDHRQVRVALDAMRYHELKAKTDAATQKVREAPKMQKPGKPKKKMSVETQAMLNARKRFQKSGSMEDAAALIQQRLKR